ncbi:MAG TPA: phosphate ABC transporter permease subunit PstC [Bacilli bacterium]|nr:phosphate ABC transporter permease subunit PstC [Bacilli bacterium]
MAVPNQEGNAAAPGFNKGRMFNDKLMRWLFVGSAILVSLIIFSIILFVGKQGVLTFQDVSPLEFFFSTDWSPSKDQYGALTFILGTFIVTAVALVLAVPLAVGGAVFMAKIAPNWMREIMRPATDLFVGIPSVVYGLVGLTVFVPFFAKVFGSAGFGVMPAAIILAIMILPTILSVSEDAIRTLPGALEEASYALGATRWQTIRKVLLPAATPGILTGVILGMGRAIGEAMAVQMVIGNAPILPTGLAQPTSVLTTQIVQEMPNSIFGTTTNNALFLMSLVLLLVSLSLILIIRLVARRREA